MNVPLSGTYGIYFLRSEKLLGTVTFTDPHLTTEGFAAMKSSEVSPEDGESISEIVLGS